MIICHILFCISCHVLDRYPAIICHPQRVTAKHQKIALQNIGKKHTVLYYQTLQFDFATAPMLRPYKENKEVLLQEVKDFKKWSKHVSAIELGCNDADVDLEKSKSERLTSNYPYQINNGRKRKTKSQSKKGRTAKAVASGVFSDPADVSVFNIPKPAMAPGHDSVELPAGKVGMKRKLSTEKPANGLSKKRKKAASLKLKKAGSEPEGEKKLSSDSLKDTVLSEIPISEGSESDGEAEFDFDDIKQDNDEDYVDEPKKKKSRISSSSRDKKKPKDEVFDF